VGQDEEPPAAVACACLSRCEQARLWRVAQAAKVGGDVGVSQRQVSLDIFAPDPLRVHFLDDARDLRPEMAGIGITAAPPCVAEGLAWITGRDEMNAVTPSAAVEGSQVVPDSRLTQGRVVHPRHESGRRMAFPLDESHSSVVWLGDVQAKIESSITCAERDSAQFVSFGLVVGM
jgi:hypothetical protein